MDLFEAIKGRRSCREFLPDPVDTTLIETLLEAGSWAPSPMNAQPWRFLVITNLELRRKIHEEAERCRKWAFETSGWKWLDRYGLTFFDTAPVLVAVIGDPSKTGVDMLLEEGSMGYQHACAAAIQNIHLAAYALGLGTLWFTLFDKKALRGILGLAQEEIPLGLILVGKPAGPMRPVPRKPLSEKVLYLA